MDCHFCSCLDYTDKSSQSRRKWFVLSRIRTLASSSTITSSLILWIPFVICVLPWLFSLSQAIISRTRLELAVFVPFVACSSHSTRSSSLALQGPEFDIKKMRRYQPPCGSRPCSVFCVSPTSDSSFLSLLLFVPLHAPRVLRNDRLTTSLECRGNTHTRSCWRLILVVAFSTFPATRSRMPSAMTVLGRPLHLSQNLGMESRRRSIRRVQQRRHCRLRISLNDNKNKLQSANLRSRPTLSQNKLDEAPTAIVVGSQHRLPRSQAMARILSLINQLPE